jgi:phosphatidate phosphatase APP1
MLFSMSPAVNGIYIGFSDVYRNSQASQSSLLLKDIKQVLLISFGRGGGHNHKFDKIKHILEFYPNLKYVLVGDDSNMILFV